MFDRVRQLTPEGAADGRADRDRPGGRRRRGWQLQLGPLATWAAGSVVRKPRARGPELRLRLTRPSIRSGSPTVPAACPSHPAAPRRPLTHIENPCAWPRPFIATAEGTGPAPVPPRRELAGRLAGSGRGADRERRPRLRQERADLPAPNANPGRFPPDPAGYAVATVRLRKAPAAGSTRATAASSADAVAGAEAVIQVRSKPRSTS